MTFFLLFPTGRFVPGFTRWGVLVAVLLETHYVFLSGLFHKQVGALDSLGFAAFLLILVGLQVHRYRSVSTFRERQQTRWVVFGFSFAFGGFVLFLIVGNIISPEVRNSQVLTVLVEETGLGCLLFLLPICHLAFAPLRY